MAPSKKKFYITNAIPYVNAPPHIGHALEFIQSDVIARYHRMQGDEVLLLCGGDENALKNVHAAEKMGEEVQSFVDRHTELFRDLARVLSVEFDVFQKGSDQVHHYVSSQTLWQRCLDAGDIYKKAYQGLYCLGCEAFYLPSELNEHRECFEHPGRALEEVSEENYFFRLSKYQSELMKLLTEDVIRIIPETRKNEMLAFLKEPLEDISISRSNERAKNWGVPVPSDPSQRMYVWFDALNIYQSGVGFGWDNTQYEKWWPAEVHVIGKGILRFHAIFWPAFLLSAKLKLPKVLFVHGYLTAEGQKMSKTLGNVVDPFELVRKYGAEPLRYYLLREIPSTGDGDFGAAKLEERYNGDLANGLGNLVARVATLGVKVSPLRIDVAKDILPEIRSEIEAAFARQAEAFEAFRLNEALAEAWRLIGFTDRYINTQKPWAIVDETAFRGVLTNASYLVHIIAGLIRPFLPLTSDRIREQILFSDSTIEIKKGAVLFPRLNADDPKDRAVHTA